MANFNAHELAAQLLDLPDRPVYCRIEDPDGCGSDNVMRIGGVVDNGAILTLVEWEPSEAERAEILAAAERARNARLAARERAMREEEALQQVDF